MSYRIPDDRTVCDAIKKVMSSHPLVESQCSLTKLVKAEISKSGGEYRIGGERIRMLGIANDLVKLTIEYRDKENGDLPEICPVCGNGMKPVMNMSLEGNNVEIKRKCSVCPFSVGQIMQAPGRYVFTRASGKEVTEEEKRRRKLERARGLIRAASILVFEATDRTVSAPRGERISSILSETEGSADDPNSIRNIILELRDSEREAPVWTRPTVSIKHVDRKDI